MGEIAEMMLDGTLCECCGCYIGDGEGYPRYCSPQCARDRGATYIDDQPTKGQRRHSCGVCGRKLKSAEGVEQHMRDKHGQAIPPQGGRK